tara:strand:- start:473 stop:1261 length:789 start_codon:yes stop_codon:yes gene_type:complete
MTDKQTEKIILEKIKLQGGVPTFFDNLAYHLLIKTLVSDESKENFKQLFFDLMDSKSTRYSHFHDRKDKFCAYTKNKSSIEQISFLMSQGTHSIIQWKDYDIFKTVYDLIIYMQILSEIKPSLIIEYGSGSGGSALWIADIASTIYDDFKIYSYDINKPNLTHNKIQFEEIDLEKDFPIIKKDKSRKMVIEDAHVNIENVLLETDRFLTAGDYLIVEDSGMKTKEIEIFLSKAKNNYMVDNYYADFFGRNATSAIDTIFVVF